MYEFKQLPGLENIENFCSFNYPKLIAAISDYYNVNEETTEILKMTNITEKTKRTHERGRAHLVAYNYGINKPLDNKYIRLSAMMKGEIITDDQEIFQMCKFNRDRILAGDYRNAGLFGYFGYNANKEQILYLFTITPELWDCMEKECKENPALEYIVKPFNEKTLNVKRYNLSKTKGFYNHTKWEKFNIFKIGNWCGGGGSSGKSKKMELRFIRPDGRKMTEEFNSMKNLYNKYQGIFSYKSYNSFKQALGRAKHEEKELKLWAFQASKYKSVKTTIQDNVIRVYLEDVNYTPKINSFGDLANVPLLDNTYTLNSGILSNKGTNTIEGENSLRVKGILDNNLREGILSNKGTNELCNMVF
jgi:hypothetical protein